MFYLLLTSPTLGDLLQNGNTEREFAMNLDYTFWFKIAFAILLFAFIAKLAIKPSRASRERTRRMQENIHRNRAREFGGGSRDLSHNSSNPHYRQGGCRNGCGSCVVHGCSKKDDNGNILLDTNGKEQTHYNPNRCRNCKNNSWCICCTGTRN